MGITRTTVGKQTLWKLSFVYITVTLHVNLTFQIKPKFGKFVSHLLNILHILSYVEHILDCITVKKNTSLHLVA